MTTSTIDRDRIEELISQIVTDGGAALGVLLVSVGDSLGLWQALARLGPCTAAALAQQTDTHERMIREWLSAQAAGGYVDYDAERQLFSLTPEQAHVLADPTSPAFMGGLFQCVEAWSQATDNILDAAGFRDVAVAAQTPFSVVLEARK